MSQALALSTITEHVLYWDALDHAKAEVEREERERFEQAVADALRMNPVVVA